MKEHIKIAILDDETLFRKSFQTLLSLENDFQLVFSGSNGEELLEYLRLAENIHPDVVLVDVRMPVLNGIETIKLISEKYSKIHCVALTVFDSNIYKEQMINQGAVGYITKNAFPDVVFDTIRKVVEKGYYFDENMLDFIIKNRTNECKNQTLNPFILSQRESEILNLLGKQYSNKEIADKLFISERTVEGHRNSMLTKTNSKNIVELILWGIKNQIVALEF